MTRSATTTDTGDPQRFCGLVGRGSIESQSRWHLDSILVNLECQLFMKCVLLHRNSHFGDIGRQREWQGL